MAKQTTSKSSNKANTSNKVQTEAKKTSSYKAGADMAKTIK